MTVVADVLNGAADLIERDGWVQGIYRRGNRHCIAGAIDVAAGCFGIMPNTEACLARTAVGITVDTSPARWNDAAGRTKAEVIAALRVAAERAAMFGGTP